MVKELENLKKDLKKLMNLKNTEKKKDIKETDQDHTDMWNTIRHSNIHVKFLPQGGERERKCKDFLEVLISEKTT
jgi:hypothetical protein